MKTFPINPSDARSMVLTHGGVDRPPFMGMGRRFMRDRSELRAHRRASAALAGQQARAERGEWFRFGHAPQHSVPNPRRGFDCTTAETTTWCPSGISR